MSEPGGRVESIWRFPIKSFQGEAVARAALSSSGIYGDRVLALRSEASGKIVSAKDAKLGDRLLELEAFYESEPAAGEPLPRVLARIGGEEIAADEPERFHARCSEALGQPVTLVSAGDAGQVYESYWPEVEEHPLSGATIDLPLPLGEQGSFADLEPLHLLTTASLAQLAELAPESEIAVARFRPSLLLDTGAAAGFVEHGWSGRRARLGGATLEIGGATPRCIMTTRPQQALPRDPSILRTLVQRNRHEVMGMQMACLGVYAKVIEPGPVEVGDALELE